MKNKILLALISSLFITNFTFADEYKTERNFYTGESFFSSPSKYIEEGQNENDSNSSYNEDTGMNTTNTTPPLKKLRNTLQQKSLERQEKKNQLAPVMPDSSIYNSDTETSDYASKELKEEFDENMMPDGFEADEQAVEEKKKTSHFWSKNKSDNKDKSATPEEENTENIILDCDNMDYDTDNYCLYATGNVNVEFVKQDTVVKADEITYDRMNNTIKAEGNVVIVKNGQNIYGDYIFVDLNEENALIENPITSSSTIELRAKKGYVYGNKIVQEQGSVDVKDTYPIVLKPSNGAPRVLTRMITPKEQTLQNDMENGLVKLKARELVITQKGDLETIAIKHADIKKGKYTLLKIPAVKIYTNKNHDYAESNILELGSYSNLGSYIGPGFVFELPKGSVLKAMPILNYDHKFGIGAMGRFTSGTNQTHAAYGTTNSKILVRGYQILDDNLFLQYAMNDYIDEWFMGRRRPKYGINLAYRKAYTSDSFLIKDRQSTFKHVLDFGYFQDSPGEHHYSKLKSSGIGTTRLRYMAQVEQNLFRYADIPNQKLFEFNVNGQVLAGVYGTGDVQALARIGPNIHTQYKRWMQDIGYFQSVYNDGTPMPVFDSYRFGKGNLYLKEYFRICKYLTLSWYGSMNITGDSLSDDRFLENTFWITVGPDDIKFNVGYDVIRQSTFFAVEVKTDAKGAHVDYDKLVIKRDKKPSEEAKEPKKEQSANFKNSEKAPVLEHAEVENIKAVEDVL